MPGSSIRYRAFMPHISRTSLAARDVRTGAALLAAAMSPMLHHLPLGLTGHSRNWQVWGCIRSYMVIIASCPGLR
ncbi:hypothetical protein D3C75_1104780 [compost metagenome]